MTVQFQTNAANPYQVAGGFKSNANARSGFASGVHFAGSVSSLDSVRFSKDNALRFGNAKPAAVEKSFMDQVKEFFQKLLNFITFKGFKTNEEIEAEEAKNNNAPASDAPAADPTPAAQSTTDAAPAEEAQKADEPVSSTDVKAAQQAFRDANAAIKKHPQYKKDAAFKAQVDKNIQERRVIAEPDVFRGVYARGKDQKRNETERLAFLKDNLAAFRKNKSKLIPAGTPNSRELNSKANEAYEAYLQAQIDELAAKGRKAGVKAPRPVLKSSPATEAPETKKDDKTATGISEDQLKQEANAESQIATSTQNVPLPLRTLKNELESANNITLAAVKGNAKKRKEIKARIQYRNNIISSGKLEKMKIHLEIMERTLKGDSNYPPLLQGVVQPSTTYYMAHEKAYADLLKGYITRLEGQPQQRYTA